MFSYEISKRYVKNMAFDKEYEGKLKNAQDYTSTNFRIKCG